MKTFENQAEKNIPLACDAPPVKSSNFCPKHMTCQNYSILDANVWVPSIYHDYLQYQLWRAICENLSQNHFSTKSNFFKSKSLTINKVMIITKKIRSKLTLKKVQFHRKVVLRQVFTYRSPELILQIIEINGRHQNVRVKNAMILICPMFWAKTNTFHRRSVTSKGNLFLAWFSKVFML